MHCFKNANQVKAEEISRPGEKDYARNTAEFEKKKLEIYLQIN